MAAYTSGTGHASPRCRILPLHTTLRAEKEGRYAALLPGDGIPQGRVGEPTLVYDEEKDLFRFRDGRFAFFYLIAYTAIVSLVRESLFPEVGE
jgi:hypothetical protein